MGWTDHDMAANSLFWYLRLSDAKVAGNGYVSGAGAEAGAGQGGETRLGRDRILREQAVLFRLCSQ